MHWSNLSNDLIIKVKYFKAWHFVAMIASIFTTLKIWYVLFIHWGLMAIAHRQNTSVGCLLRKWRKGFTKRARVTYVTKKHQRYSLINEANKLLCVGCLVLLVPMQQAKANFEIISSDMKVVQSSKDIVKAGSLPFSERRSGVGSDSKLADVVELLVSAPFTAEFISQEIKSLKVDWMSAGNSVAEVFALMGRNYGFESYYVESSGKIYFDWSKEICSAAVDREVQTRAEIQAKVGFASGKPVTPKVIRVIRNEKTYLC